MSKGEEKILAILRRASKSSLVWNIQREVIYKDLTYKGAPLRYDIRFQTRKGPILIEVDGLQHFSYNKYFHKKYSTFRHMQANDRRKNEYALNHNIHLIRIPYWDLDSIHNLADILRPQYTVKSKFHNDDLIIQRKRMNLNKKS